MIEVVVFPCTYKCDGKCIMCSIHERKCKDMSIEILEKKFFSNEKVKKIKSLNLTGGEPTLRDDLPQLLQMILNHCTMLSEIIINTNGLNPEHIIRQIKSLCNIIPENIKIWIYISLDSVENSDCIRGVLNSSKKAIQTVKRLKELKSQYKNIRLGISCTITSSNYNQLSGVLNFAKEEQLLIDFICATVNSAYINSESKAEKFVMDSFQKGYVINFFENVKEYERDIISSTYIEEVIKRLKGIEGEKECIFREGRGLLLEADGKLRTCGMTDKILLGDISNTVDWDLIGEHLSSTYTRYCNQCDTTSYYNWTHEMQKELSLDMFSEVIRRRKAEND